MKDPSFVPPDKKTSGIPVLIFLATNHHRGLVLSGDNTRSGSEEGCINSDPRFLCFEMKRRHPNLIEEGDKPNTR